MELEEADSADSNPPISGNIATLSQFIENMGLHFEDYGIPRIGGKILGLLIVSQRPVSSEEMSDILQASRSSISTNLRTLLMTGLTDKVTLPGEREDFYVFSDEAWETSLEMRLEGIQSLREMAEDGMQDMPEDHPARQRLEEVLDWTNLVEDAYEKLIKKWQDRKEVPA